MENMIHTTLRVINHLNSLVFCDLGGICHCSVVMPRLFSFALIFVLSVSLLLIGQSWGEGISLCFYFLLTH